MRLFLIAALLSLPFLLSACESNGTYPVSGDACGPDDPVQSLDTADCVIPSGV